MIYKTRNKQAANEKYQLRNSIFILNADIFQLNKQVI
jgi:hypothetical protein